MSAPSGESSIPQRADKTTRTTPLFFRQVFQVSTQVKYLLRLLRTTPPNYEGSPDFSGLVHFEVNG